MSASSETRIFEQAFTDVIANLINHVDYWVEVETDSDRTYQVDSFSDAVFEEMCVIDSDTDFDYAKWKKKAKSTLISLGIKSWMKDRYQLADEMYETGELDTFNWSKYEPLKSPFHLRPYR